MANSAKQLVAAIDTVASLPEIVKRIDDLIQDPESDLSSIANVIAEDVGLSAQLLKIANSAMFNFPSEVDTITRAITVIGTRQLRDLVLATKVISTFKDIEIAQFDMKAFWKHSIAAGIMARIFAALRREINTEYYYLLGLFHEIGRLVMYMEMPEQMQRVHQHAKDNNVSQYQSELTIVGFDHAIVGAELIAAWNLPQQMQDAICFHHRPLLSINHAVDSSIIHVADLVVNALQFCDSEEMDIPQFEEQAWETLGLSQFVLSEAVEQLDYQYREVVSLLLEE